MVIIRALPAHQGVSCRARQQLAGDRERDIHVYFVLSTRMQKGPDPWMPRWIDRSVRLEPDQFSNPYPPSINFVSAGTRPSNRA